MRWLRRSPVLYLCVIAACGGADESSEPAESSPEPAAAPVEAAQADPAAALKQDLKNLASQEEMHYAENFSYSVALDSIGFTPSEGVLLAVVADSAGWMAVATSEDDSAQCVLRFGPLDPDSVEPENRVGESSPGEIKCVGAP